VVAIPPAGAPAAAEGWMDYAAVLLADATGTLLDEKRRLALEEYVRGGGGLVLIGAGPHEKPADRDDPLNRVAALIANPYERRPMKVIVALDASGSMAEPGVDAAGPSKQVKFDLAVEAVMSLQRHLTGADLLEVIAFSDSARLAYDGGKGPPDFGALRDALAGVSPGGSTDVMAALRLATRAAAPTDRQGLVILVSDLVPTRPFDPVAAAEMFKDKNLSLAIVAVVSGGRTQPAAAGLEVLADRLKAPLVRRESLTGLAEVFARFLRLSRGDAIRRGGFRPDEGGSALGLPAAAMPGLDAYILCAGASDAEVSLRAQGDPLLARRRAGLGRSVSFAVPLGGDNAALRSSAWFKSLLAAAVQWAIRPGDDPRFAGQISRTGTKLRILLTAQDASGPMNLLELSARAEFPAQGRHKVREVPLAQTAPGRYEADLDVGAGPLSLLVRLADGGVVWREALAQTCPSEFAAIGANWENLQRLADLTGGRIVRGERLQDLTRQWRQGRYRDAWPFLLAAAVAVMLLEWCLTRVWRKGR